MRTIQPGHEVLSLFAITSKVQAFTKDPAQRRLIRSLGGAFLMVAIVGFILSVVQSQASSGVTPTAATVSEQSEPAAFIPGQFVSEQLARGYIGR